MLVSRSHYKLLGQYKKRVDDFFSQADSIMGEAESQAETLDALTRDGLTITEDITRRLLKLNRDFADMANDMCFELLDHLVACRENQE